MWRDSRRTQYNATTHITQEDRTLDGRITKKQDMSNYRYSVHIFRTKEPRTILVSAQYIIVHSGEGRDMGKERGQGTSSRQYFLREINRRGRLIREEQTAVLAA